MTTIDRSLSIKEAMRENPQGVLCSICMQDVPKAHDSVKASVCDRCTTAKANQYVAARQAAEEKK